MERIHPTLKAYIETQIIPQYESFDAAHHIDHVQTVIQQSLKLSKYYDVDINMVYTIAAYHDTGLCKGREFHHIESGKIILADQQLRQWFSKEQLRIMAEAAEDHRASSKYKPRSIYGRIVAEADRNIVPETIIKRTIQYGLAHYPELDKQAQYERMLDHMHEKYDTGGYLKLWIPESSNAERLKQLRNIIHDEQKLRYIFDNIWTALIQKSNS